MATTQQVAETGIALHSRLARFHHRISNWSIVKAAKSGGERAHRVAVQGYEKARLSGARLARHVLHVQQDSGLPDKAIVESIKSVGMRQMGRYSDMSWQQAYVAAAEKGLFGPAADPGATSPDKAGHWARPFRSGRP